MATDYKDMAESIVAALGGTVNIKSVTHCATRLRFGLRVQNAANKKTLEAIPGVLGTQVAAGTYQVLIGTNVADVYDTLIATTGVSAGGEVDADVEDAKSEKMGLFTRFTRMMSDVFAPYIPVLAVGGIVGGIVSLLAKFGLMDTAGVTYQAFYGIFYSLIYFFPILLAFTAAKHFNCNPYVAVVVGASLMYPGLSDLLQTGSVVSMFGINFTAFNMASSFIPILLAIFVMSFIEKWLKKVLPQVLQFILVPLVCLAVMVPLTVIVIGPIGGWIANGIKWAYTYLFKITLVGDLLFGALFIFVILLGLHWAVTPIMLGILAAQGYEYGLAAGGMGNYAVLGVCLAILVLSKNAEQRTVAGSAAFVNALSGITEPGLYGIILKDKRYFISLIAGGAAGGLVCGLFNVAIVQFAFSGILSFGAYLSAINFAWYCVAIAATIVVSFGVTVLVDKSLRTRVRRTVEPAPEQVAVAAA